MTIRSMHCIAHTHKELKGKAWCGNKLSSMDWCFESIDHAVYAINQSSIAVCPDCLNAIIKVVTDER